jgi:hypothetical protein
MSSSGITYFVVTYDHDSETFALDSFESAEKYPRDTWDTVEEKWVYLDTNLDLAEDISSLSRQLTDILKKGQSENGNEYNIGLD